MIKEVKYRPISQTTFNCDINLKAKAVEKADEEHRTLTAVLEALLQKWTDGKVKL